MVKLIFKIVSNIYTHAYIHTLQYEHQLEEMNILLVIEQKAIETELDKAVKSLTVNEKNQNQLYVAIANTNLCMGKLKLIFLIPGANVSRCGIPAAKTWDSNCL